MKTPYQERRHQLHQLVLFGGGEIKSPMSRKNTIMGRKRDTIINFTSSVLLQPGKGLLGYHPLHINTGGRPDMNELLEVSFKSILTATIEESVDGWVDGS